MSKCGFSYTMRIFFSKDEKDEDGEASGASLHGPMEGLSALSEAPSHVLTGDKHDVPAAGGSSRSHNPSVACLRDTLQ